MWPMPSWTRSWPAAANKACFFKRNSRPGKRVFPRSAGAVLRFSAPAAHPLHQFFRPADAGCRAPQFSGEPQQKKQLCQGRAAKFAIWGRSALAELRCIAGTAAPCARCLSNIHMRVRLAPAGQPPDMRSRALQFSGERSAKQKRPCRSRAVESSIFRVDQRLLNWGASLARLRRARDA